MRSGNDVGQEGLTDSLHSNSSQRSCIRLISDRTVGFLIHVFMDPALCPAVDVVTGRSLKCSHKVGSIKLSKSIKSSSLRSLGAKLNS